MLTYNNTNKNYKYEIGTDEAISQSPMLHEATTTASSNYLPTNKRTIKRSINLLPKNRTFLRSLGLQLNEQNQRK